MCENQFDMETVTTNERQMTAYREDAIEHLTGNCSCEAQSIFTEDARDWLESLDDEALMRLDDRQTTHNEDTELGASFEAFVANSRLSRQRTSGERETPLVAPGLFDDDRQDYREPVSPLVTNAQHRQPRGHRETPLIPMAWTWES